ncbi:envelope stress response membrane protein PspC [Gayadomonas joobiniege]|uniref:envelope stress response membrane protein PspC n=1 Tax=Gayadomonas joobiniege TaxID=1234606 RepID=UPI00036FE4FB|nr:envelope stress response membrane protein PspC [Gayadomonas joobiniege]
MNSRPKTLKRSMHNRRIAGVCGGIAKYFGLETWLVRVVTVGALFFSFSLIAFVYIAAWMILDSDDLSDRASKGRTFEATSTDDYHFDIKSHAWQAGEPPKQALSSLSKAFDKLEARIQSVERIVTSKSFKVSREIDRL